MLSRMRTALAVALIRRFKRRPTPLWAVRRLQPAGNGRMGVTTLISLARERAGLAFNTLPRWVRLNDARASGFARPGERDQTASLRASMRGASVRTLIS